MGEYTKKQIDAMRSELDNDNIVKLDTCTITYDYDRNTIKVSETKGAKRKLTTPNLGEDLFSKCVHDISVAFTNKTSIDDIYEIISKVCKGKKFISIPEGSEMRKIVEAKEVDDKKNKQLLNDCERYLMMIEEEIEGANPGLCRTAVLNSIKSKLADVFDTIESKLGIE